MLIRSKTVLFCLVKEYHCLITGAGNCHNSGNPKSEVMVFMTRLCI